MMPDARPRGGWMAHTFKVRFHLHPTVRAHKDADGNIVILRLPAGGTWRFRLDGGSVDIAEGIYLGAAGQAMRAAKQIVVSGVTGAADGNNIVANIRWSLQRIAVAQSVATDEMPVGLLQTGERDRDRARVAEDLFS